MTNQDQILSGLFAEASVIFARIAAALEGEPVAQTATPAAQPAAQTAEPTAQPAAQTATPAAQPSMTVEEFRHAAQQIVRTNPAAAGAVVRQLLAEFNAVGVDGVAPESRQAFLQTLKTRMGA